MTLEQQLKFDQLKEAASPLIEYLCENHNPHVTVIVTSTSVELLGGMISIPEKARRHKLESELENLMKS